MSALRFLLLALLCCAVLGNAYGQGGNDILLELPSVDEVEELLPEGKLADVDEMVGVEIVEALEEELEPEYQPIWFEPAYWWGPIPWDAGIEFGLNGSEGVNESLSMRAGAHLKHKTKLWKWASSIAYNRNAANGVETQNNALFDLRIDRVIADSPWSLFFLHQTLYDEFQAFDLRISVNEGLAYQFIDNETVELLGRFGAGTSREFGGPDDSWAPEALFGVEYEHELTKLQRLSAKVDYYPQWDDFNQFRVVTDIGWEIDLDRPKNLSLKFALTDRYDSTPNGAEANEVNYSALLIWGL